MTIKLLLDCSIALDSLNERSLSALGHFGFYTGTREPSKEEAGDTYMYVCAYVENEYFQ